MALLVIDLDGTLLSRDGSVSTRNREALRRARDSGFEIVLATGRSWKESRGALGTAGPDDLFIGAGGSVINRAQDGRTLRSLEIDVDVVADLARLLLDHGHRAQLLKDHQSSDHDYCLIGDQALDEASRWWFETHQLTRVEVSCPVDAHQRQLTAQTLRVGTVAAAVTLRECAEQVRRHHGDSVHAQQWGALTATETIGSETHLLEIFARGVDKWTAVEWICAERGLDPERVAAIGDGLNDLGMVTNAALGIAMGNAIAPVRDSADRVVAPFFEDGAADAIELAMAHFGGGVGR